MPYHLAKLILLAFMLIGHIGQASSFSAVDCVQSDGMMSAAMMSHAGHDMMPQDTGPSHAAASEVNCCQQDCYCPMGLIVPAILVDIALKTPIDSTAMQPADRIESIHAVFLAQPKRPPKFNSLTA